MVRSYLQSGRILNGRTLSWVDASNLRDIPLLYYTFPIREALHRELSGTWTWRELEDFCWEPHMNKQPVDLIGIENEPTDEQLSALMNAVAIEARKKSRAAHEQLMDNLRKEISRVSQLQESI